MQEVYVIKNENEEYFDHFNQWQGKLHANFLKTKTKIYTNEKLAKSDVLKIETICMKPAKVVPVFVWG